MKSKQFIKQREFQEAQKRTQQDIYEIQERQKYEPIYSPRTSLKRKKDEETNLLNELLLKLDPFTISILNNDFAAAGGELKVEEFVLMMRHHLADWKPDLSNRLRKLNMQLNDNSVYYQNIVIEWEELANYVMGKGNTISSTKQQRKGRVKNYTKQEIHLNYKVITNIKKLVFIPSLDKIVFFEEGSNFIQLMNHSTGALSSKPLKIEPEGCFVNSTSIKKDSQGLFYVDEKIQEIKRRTLILDMIYFNDKKHHFLMVASTDRFVRAYKITNNGFVAAVELKNNSSRKIQKQFKCEISCMSWDEQRELLLCGGIDGNIEFLDINTLDEDQSKFKLIPLTGGHSDIITSLICLPKLEFTVSASLDGKLILWDTIEHKLKIAYKGHTRGITTLAYDPSTILLFSAGFDHWVNIIQKIYLYSIIISLKVGVWNPYTDHMVYKIANYKSPIQHIAVIEGCNQLISLDVRGNVNIRDIQKFNNHQNFTLEQDQGFHFNATSFCYAKSANFLKLIFCGQSICVYNYDSAFNPQLCDDKPPLCCVMNSNQLKFFTPAGNAILGKLKYLFVDLGSRIKVWCALTGEVDKIFLDITYQESDITAFCIDAYEKRMIIGDKRGYVSSFNCENGAKIMPLPRHNSSISVIKDSIELQILVTASNDGKINIVSTNFTQNQDCLLRSIQLQEQLITCIEIYLLASSIMVGLQSGLVLFFEISSGRCLGEFKDKQISASFQITDLLILPEIPFFIASTQNGAINFISGPPLFYKFQVVEKIQNIDQTLLEEEKEIEEVGITKIKYCKGNKYLYFVDFNGYLKCYDISKIVDNLYSNINQQQPNNQFQSKSHAFSSFRQYINSNFNTQPEIKWFVKATQDQITHLEFNFEHKLLLVCTSGKSVQIFNSETGKLIESLQQNEELILQKPIGLRKKNTLDMYDNQAKIRIDRTAEEDEQMEKMKQQEYLYQLKKQIKQQQQHKQAQQLNNESIENKERFLELRDSSQISSEQNQSPLKQKNSEKPNAFQKLDEEYWQEKNFFVTNSPALSEIDIEYMNEEQEGEEQDQNSNQSQDNSISLQAELNDRNIFNEYPQSEFDPFFFFERIKKEEFKLLKSKPQWKLEINYRQFWEKKWKTVEEVQEKIDEKQNRIHLTQLKGQKFKIIRFEVDLDKFDPQKDFQPKIAISRKDNLFSLELDSLDPKFIAENYYKKKSKEFLESDNKTLNKQPQETTNIQENEEKIIPSSPFMQFKRSQLWETFSQSKTNFRDQTSNKFWQIVEKKIKLTDEEMEKLKEFYMALKEVEQRTQGNRVKVFSKEEKVDGYQKGFKIKKLRGQKGGEQLRSKEKELTPKQKQLLLASNSCKRIIREELQFQQELNSQNKEEKFKSKRRFIFQQEEKKKDSLILSENKISTEEISKKQKEQCQDHDNNNNNSFRNEDLSLNDDLLPCSPNLSQKIEYETTAEKSGKKLAPLEIKNIQYVSTLIEQAFQSGEHKEVDLDHMVANLTKRNKLEKLIK